MTITDLQISAQLSPHDFGDMLYALVNQVHPADSKPKNRVFILGRTAKAAFERWFDPWLKDPFLSAPPSFDPVLDIVREHRAKMPRISDARAAIGHRGISWPEQFIAIVRVFKAWTTLASKLAEFSDVQKAKAPEQLVIGRKSKRRVISLARENYHTEWALYVDRFALPEPPNWRSKKGWLRADPPPKFKPELAELLRNDTGFKVRLAELQAEVEIDEACHDLDRKYLMPTYQAISLATTEAIADAITSSLDLVGHLMTDASAEDVFTDQADIDTFVDQVNYFTDERLKTIVKSIFVKMDLGVRLPNFYPNMSPHMAYDPERIKNAVVPAHAVLSALRSKTNP